MTKKINWDAIGIATSIACAIHCALLPLILTSLPLFGVNIINNLPFEFCMILLAFCVGAYALYHGWKKHHHRWVPLIIFCGGMFLLFCKQIWYSDELFFLIPAVIFIVSAHYLNFRFCRSYNHAHQDDCDH
jgi:MerC mercury resistance protein